MRYHLHVHRGRSSEKTGCTCRPWVHFLKNQLLKGFWTDHCSFMNAAWERFTCRPHSSLLLRPSKNLSPRRKKTHHITDWQIFSISRVGATLLRSAAQQMDGIKGKNKRSHKPYEGPGEIQAVFIEPQSSQWLKGNKTQNKTKQKNSNTEAKNLTGNRQHSGEMLHIKNTWTCAMLNIIAKLRN